MVLIVSVKRVPGTCFTLRYEQFAFTVEETFDDEFGNEGVEQLRIDRIAAGSALGVVEQLGERGLVNPFR